MGGGSNPSLYTKFFEIFMIIFIIFGIMVIFIKKVTMNPNDYEMQQKRAWSRKLELIIKMGGECSKCGYKKNVAALEFHHIDPSQKKFPLDSRHLSNTSMDKILYSFMFQLS